MPINEISRDFRRADEFVAAWICGCVCLHPTDTIPGLSFNPDLAISREQFFQLKKRDPTKPSICLVANTSVAFSYWQDLPSRWSEKLSHKWPSGLSIIWKASSRCPVELKNSDNELALRVPLWRNCDKWMQFVLERLACPFPTSSVNFAGQPAAENWNEAVSFLLHLPFKVFVPEPIFEESKIVQEGMKKPSTLIRIDPFKNSGSEVGSSSFDVENSYEMIREGSLPKEQIDRWLKS